MVNKFQVGNQYDVCKINKEIHGINYVQGYSMNKFV